MLGDGGAPVHFGAFAVENPAERHTEISSFQRIYLFLQNLLIVPPAVHRCLLPRDEHLSFEDVRNDDGTSDVI